MTRGIDNISDTAPTTEALIINSMLKMRRWNIQNGQPLTFSFPTSVDVPYGQDSGLATYLDGSGIPLVDQPGKGQNPVDDLTETFEAASASLQSVVVSALTSQFAAVTPLTFQQKPASTLQNYYSSAASQRQNGVDISIAVADLTTGGYGLQPGDGRRSGDVWFDDDPSRFGNGGQAITKGSNDYRVVMHELGHALGLRHPHEGVVGSDLEPGVVMPAGYDSMEYSIMTYRMYSGMPIPSPESSYPNDVEAHSFAQSLMMYDIMALQYMYGANFNTNSGSTTYKFSPTTGEMFINNKGQGRPGGANAGPEANRIFLTIWDGGGQDTYDFSSYTTNLEIDLRPGQFTNLDTQLALLDKSDGIYAGGNVYNALQYKGDARSLIENAKGGSGHDVIVGNTAANKLYGNDGDDVLTGWDGDEFVSPNQDKLYGGKGDDTYVVYDQMKDLVFESANQGEDTVLFAGLGQYALVANTENLRFGSGGGFRTGYGNALNNTMWTTSDPVNFHGMAGDDTLTGSIFYDQLFGDGGNDVLQGGLYIDEIHGGDGNDELWGYGGTAGKDGNGNTLVDGTDWLYGEGGNDRFVIGIGVVDGTDNIDGGAGIDTLDLTTVGAVTAEVDLKAGTWKYQNEWDGYAYWSPANVIGVENVTGGNGDDILTGSDGDNVLDGGGGNDTLKGGLGNDTYGVDTPGDVIVENASEGIDTIETDLAVLSLAGYASIESLRYSGDDNFTGTGNALANRIEGGDWDDTLDGGDDAATVDVLVGGEGNDTYRVRHASDVIIEGFDKGWDKVVTALTVYTLAANVDNLELEGAGAHTAYGNMLGNVIDGSIGADTIYGLGGDDLLTGGADSVADVLIGGIGDDRYDIFEANDTITELAGGGTDTIVTGLHNVDLASYANVENVRLGSSGGTFSVKGSSAANVLTGYSGDDTLDGRDGNDVLEALFGGKDKLIGGRGNELQV